MCILPEGYCQKAHHSENETEEEIHPYLTVEILPFFSSFYTKKICVFLLTDFQRISGLLYRNPRILGVSQEIDQKTGIKCAGIL